MKSQKIALAHYQQLNQLIKLISDDLVNLESLCADQDWKMILSSSIEQVNLLKQEAEMLWLASFQEELITPPPEFLPQKNLRCARSTTGARAAVVL